MANNFFKFKQFTIFQDKCALKVCTDACLFGAYVANEMAQRKWKIDTCLDIGTGTGLLSLMLAQKNDVTIDAVEIDEDTFLQASENIKSSIFKKNITVYHKNILEFDTEKKYDLIIANPPFFENDLLSENNLKNTAKHNTNLTLAELMAAANNLLNATGHFAMLLPYRRLDYLKKIALGYGFYLSKKILIMQTPTHGYFRGILFFSKNNVDSMTEDLSIKNSTGKYSNEFVALLKDYYLAPF